MLKKNIDIYGLLLFSLVCTVLGIFTIVDGKSILKYNIYFVASLIALYALFDFTKVLMKKNYKNRLPQAIIKVVFDYVFAFLIFYNVDFISTGMTIVFGLYILFHSILHLINFIIYQKNKIKGGLKLIIYFFTTLTLSFLLILNPIKNSVFAEIIIGIYFIFLGISKFNDFIIEITPTKLSNNIKSHIKVQLPILFAMFIPKRLISLINETLQVKESVEIFNLSKNNNTPALEVIIHLATGGSAAFGHVEICYKDKIYSFGNYDRHSRFLFNSMGDGVVCVADKKSYIDYILNNKNRYLVIFGLHLTDSEKELVEKRLHELITKDTINYYPDIQLFEQDLLPDGIYNDMSSEIYKFANGKFKKIISGKNKKFFVLKTNCVMVASYVLNGIEGNLIALNGIISPGSYYDYLNNAFLSNNSKVITRKIYTKEKR